MSTISNIGMLTAFSAGLVSFLSPCVLPLVPGYVSYISGRTLEVSNNSTADRWQACWLGICFVLGFTTIFVALGASATAISQLLLSYRYETTILGGVIVILFGVFLTGILPLPWLKRDLRFHGSVRGGRPLGAYLLGLAFAFGWTPCIGPVLGAILMVSALSATASAGIVLLIAYSLGLGVPFLASAVFTGGLMQYLKKMRRLGRNPQFAAGLVMVVMGIAMITGTMSRLSIWLLNNIPMLAQIG
jgi:cytochrome c-type biogenesis protein